MIFKDSGDTPFERTPVPRPALGVPCCCRGHHLSCGTTGELVRSELKTTFVDLFELKMSRKPCSWWIYEQFEGWIFFWTIKFENRSPCVKKKGSGPQLGLQTSWVNDNIVPKGSTGELPGGLKTLQHDHITWYMTITITTNLYYILDYYNIIWYLMWIPKIW